MVEHAFLIIKRIFGFAQVKYRGMVKNDNRPEWSSKRPLLGLFLANSNIRSRISGSCSHVVTYSDPP